MVEEPWAHHRRGRETLSEEDQRTVRCCSRGHGLVVIQGKGRCCGLDCEEDLACEEEASGGDLDS